MRLDRMWVFIQAGERLTITGVDQEGAPRTRTVTVLTKHVQAVHKIRRIMLRASASGRPITYKELGLLIGVHYRSLSPYLDVYSEHCHRRGLPVLIDHWLVRADTRRVGAGFLEDGIAVSI